MTPLMARLIVVGVVALGWSFLYSVSGSGSRLAVLETQDDHHQKQPMAAQSNRSSDDGAALKTSTNESAAANGAGDSLHVSYDAFQENTEERQQTLEALPYGMTTYLPPSLLNLSGEEFIAHQQQRCFLRTRYRLPSQPLLSNATPDAHSANSSGSSPRSFYRVRSAMYPSINFTEAEEVLRQAEKVGTKVRVACLITGLMRTYQEVFPLLAAAILMPTRCDVFVSTEGLRGFGQLRFENTASMMPYRGIEGEVAEEIKDTFARHGLLSSLKRVNVAPLQLLRLTNNSYSLNGTANMSETTAPSSPPTRPPSLLDLAHGDGRHFAYPMYRHMLVALRLMQRQEEEERNKNRYEVLLHVRPDLWFQYPNELRVLRVPLPPRPLDDAYNSDTPDGGHGQEERSTVVLVRDGVVIALGKNTVAVNGRITGPTRVNDHLTFGSRDAMIRWMSSYYFFKYVAPPHLHSEAAKRIILNHWNITSCNMDLHVGAMKEGAQLTKKRRLKFANTVSCFRNCQWMHPIWCSAKHSTPLALTGGKRDCERQTMQR